MSWAQRALCPDGACVGVIGDDGLCSVCRRAAPGGPPLAKPASEHVDDSDDDSDEDEVDEDGDDEGADEADREDASPAAPGSAAGGEWADRALCPDGACVGVIGDDGRCRVCGKRPTTP